METSHFPTAPRSGASHDDTLGTPGRPCGPPLVIAPPHRSTYAGTQRGRAPADPPLARPQSPGTQSQRRTRDERCLR